MRTTEAAFFPGWVVLIVLVMNLYDGLIAQELSAFDPSSRMLGVTGEVLVPAALGVRADAQGNSWNIEANGSLGRVGSTMVNSGLRLLINQNPFETSLPRMTGDGREFVIVGDSLPGLPGIECARRIRFLEEKGAVRFLELFFNGSSNPVNLSIELATSFSGNFKTMVTDHARIEPVILKPWETGLLVTPGSSQSNRAFLFTLCGNGEFGKPSISSQSRYGLKFQYQVTLNPGETKGLVHVVTQTTVPADLDRQSLAGVFSPYSIEQVISTVPEGFQEFLVNRSPRNTEAGRTYETLQSNGISGAEKDRLISGAQSELLGESRISPFEVVTAYGTVSVDPDQVLAIAGKNRGIRESVRVFLRDGQILAGKVDSAEIGFVLDGGRNLEVNLEQLDWLVQGTPDSAPIVPNGAVVQTWYGDQLVIEPGPGEVITGYTAWGTLSFPVTDLAWLVPAPGDLPGHRVRLRNGTECHLFLESGVALTLREEFAEGRQLPLSHVSAIVPEKNSPGEMQATRLYLAGGQWIGGVMAQEELELFDGVRTVGVETSEIRRMKRSLERRDGLSNHFVTELWNGSRIEGNLKAGMVALNVYEKRWEIAPDDIRLIEMPGPTLSGENRKKIADLIVKLGDKAWKVRESATTELGRFGGSAVSILTTERVQHPDPEVRRRIERILDKMKESDER